MTAARPAPRGIGVAYRPEIGEACLAAGADFLEIAPDRHLDSPDDAIAEAYALRERAPIAGLALATSLATDAPPDARHTAFLARWSRAARAAWIAAPAGILRVPHPRGREPTRWPRRALAHGAEALSLGRHVAPPLTRELARAVGANARALAQALPCPVALANVAPALRAPHALDESEFLPQSAESAGARLALDLAALAANALARGDDPRETLARVDASCVGVARVGGLASFEGRLLPDARAPIPDVAWTLLCDLSARAPHTPIVVDVHADAPALAEAVARARAVVAARRFAQAPMGARA